MYVNTTIFPKPDDHPSSKLSNMVGGYATLDLDSSHDTYLHSGSSLPGFARYLGELETVARELREQIEQFLSAAGEPISDEEAAELELFDGED